MRARAHAATVAHVPRNALNVRQYSPHPPLISVVVVAMAYSRHHEVPQLQHR